MYCNIIQRYKTALIMATESGHKDIVPLLVSYHNIDINKPDEVNSKYIN
jgi:hypothetical protein